MDFANPPIDFTLLARSLGMQAHRIETQGAFVAACSDALTANEPVLLEVVVDRQRVASCAGHTPSASATSVGRGSEVRYRRF